MRFDARTHGATIPTHAPGNFMNMSWRDCSDPRHEHAWISEDETLEEFILSPQYKNRLQVEQALFGRGERIRTSDPCVPNAVRYRAALRPDKINRIATGAGIVLHQRVERQAMGIGYPLVGYLAAKQVHPFCQSSVRSHGRLHSLRGQTQQIWKRGIRQRHSRRTRNNPRHIGHTIMEHSLYHKDRVRMGRGFRGFEAATLIDCDVYHHGSRLHARHEFP